jgi:hypothetical protein
LTCTKFGLVLLAIPECSRSCVGAVVDCSFSQCPTGDSSNKLKTPDEIGEENSQILSWKSRLLLLFVFFFLLSSFFSAGLLCFCQWIFCSPFCDGAADYQPDISSPQNGFPSMATTRNLIFVLESCERFYCYDADSKRPKKKPRISFLLNDRLFFLVRILLHLCAFRFAD